VSESILERPLVRFGREITGDLGAALRREWLVTNGLGGYASGTVAGVATRRYHGMLVAALEPPVSRTVFVQGTVEWLTVGGRRVPLSTNEFQDGTIDPHGYRELEAFWLDGTIPVWRYALGETVVERRVWMPHGHDTTCLSFSLVRGDEPVEIEVLPLVTERGFHSLATPEGEPEMEIAGARMAVRFGPEGRTLHLVATAGSVAPGGYWYRDFLHREERERGLDDRSDAFAAGTFRITLGPGGVEGMMLTLEPALDMDLRASLETTRAREAQLLADAAAERSEPAFQQLVLAADQFLVDRRPAGRTVIAGYHWFNDWGRDTMISLPGLTLATGRPTEAAAILRALAPHIRDGLLPNDFPDRAGADPAYNTVDASLWYVVAIGRYVAATGDRMLLADLLPAVREIVQRHIAGTRYGIGMDPGDGLLRAGEPGVQLTWMDAKVDDWIVTPRIGKPVEINALWHNSVRLVADWSASSGSADAAELAALAERIVTSFRARFVVPGQDHLADVVDGPGGDETELRPNQVFAISLPYPLLDGEDAARVLRSTGRWLLTSHGLRSLSPADPAYQGDYRGDRRRRDGAYHQGPVWSWLIGAYVEAHLRVHADPVAARSLLAPFEDHLRDAGLGSVSEILEGDPPHLPRGCIAQAWGVAEVLRAWRLIDEARRSIQSPPPRGA
jgi:predicted glycogen debranching enzyme